METASVTSHSPALRSAQWPGAALHLSNQNALAVPGAMVVSLAGALIVDQMQSRGKVAADVALALMFYGGAAAGVVLVRDRRRRS